MDFEKESRMMVEYQLKRRGISDEKVLNAFLKVKRHLFVPKDLERYAYDDCPLPIGEGQTISQPYIIGLMLQLLELRENDVVLEIGTGSGYQTALLAEIVRLVYTIERNETLAQRAKNKFEELGYKNIVLEVGDGTKGWTKEEIEFDGIIVSAAAPKVPEPLFSQLKIGGRMVIPIGSRTFQRLHKITKLEDGNMKVEYSDGCMFVPLIGEYGW
ncbi:protein-L-isoaspartate O-methyltransferase [Petrotoga mobilis SJ95]|jgi:protein-L-isoaspartate(D-aspartate) O-methyltransferase|uniref:Protein-L-isoaspartate O-methyltransferase n=1 Tax=Petrotoga mobilis (strain DSM 10674 / SJ95) TaxID=403833 RepID=PIMT_PETMO|nr:MULTISPECIES: protein-L-isoaspartate(D-aspartate) O-methyltransferase [Petrotoga]A9BH07.1 RecName: Full=Protein-L-isoaspartate O-methyltransferase; AltName: Full=L-isoaspartyl protein carboxyl methyltransferase; AltName: Full=Protein L-isoaspartyl methyltransferase; AltName: Full=Protein-beta-aspartate methyltransferase; Short=PIMT [Petrotoga mobilis SJ95]MDK2812436.1 protein-L-isoaspartate(D-aspartate) O-methyltransferase [Petrotoga sp.]ABX32588.1 protein-L-isoaspartate O-methyltransferase [